ncbi:hypothetical protein GCM10027598_09940 [Amycolatopsis oliviviridis]|uniref:Uncharacterized protein n=1 Tax=Amycolatopsis oliviviridis TaxID=1471590 RepID=A0ABQ3LNU9_9PSEU|nr:hypothetical protein GCM10017790_43350 [Amycolatopsis oliviviridis]
MRFDLVALHAAKIDDGSVDPAKNQMSRLHIADFEKVVAATEQRAPLPTVLHLRFSLDRPGIATLPSVVGGLVDQLTEIEGGQRGIDDLFVAIHGTRLFRMPFRKLRSRRGRINGIRTSRQQADE